MAVDITDVGSAGWWMQRLWMQLRAARPRLQLLADWYDGEPPVARDDENYRRYRQLAAQSRTNFAALSIDARRNRLRMRAVRTAVDSDVEGDETAWHLLKTSQVPTESGTCHRLALTMGRAYVAVGIPEETEDDPRDELNQTARGDVGGEAASPRATIEDPRDVIHATDAFGRVRAALKLVHDDDTDRDLAVLWLRGVKYVATRPRRVRPGAKSRRPAFSAAAFTLDPDLEETWDPSIGVPVVPFTTEDELGVFEKHLGLLERIDRGTFRRDSIALAQAFRQRALIGDIDGAEDETTDLDDDLDGDGSVDDAEEEYAAVRRSENLDDILTADPGSVWTLPDGVKLWASGVADLTGVQVSKRDDVKEFAAVTFTPLSMVTPDAAAQSAEGASLQREGLLFAVEDLWDRFGYRWAHVTSLLLQMAGHDDRADLSRIVLDWWPAERHSLGSRAQAAVAGKGSGVPWEGIMTELWGFTPETVARLRQQRMDDMLIASDPTSVQLNLAVGDQGAQSPELAGVGGT